MKSSDIQPAKILDHLQFGILQVNALGKIEYANSIAIEFLKYYAEELVDIHYSEISAKNESNPITKTFDDKLPISSKWNISNGKKEETLSVSTVPVFDATDVLVGVVVSFNAAKERFKKSNPLLSNKKLAGDNEILNQAILDAIDDGILVIDKVGSIININKSLRWYISSVLIVEIKVGSSIFDFVDEFDEFDYLEKSFRSILKGEISIFEHQLKLRDTKWYNMKITPLTDRQGAVISFQNINTRKEIEIALEKSLRKYRNIYNKAPVMMHSLDKSGTIISVSDFWLEKMGYERSEVIGKSLKAFLKKSSYRIFDKVMGNLMDTGKIKNVSMDFQTKSGDIINTLLGSVAEYDENGEFERSLAGTIDITRLKKTEMDLKQSESRLLEAQRISKIGDFELDVTTREYAISSDTIALFGFSDGLVMFTELEKAIYPEDREQYLSSLDTAIGTGIDFYNNFRISHLITKEKRWISIRGKVIKNVVGDPRKIVGTFQDITEQQQAEDKIKKLSNRILLASEIAHLGIWEYDVENDSTYWSDQMYVIFPDHSSPFGLSELRNMIMDSDDEFLDKKIEAIKSGLNFVESEVQVKISDKVRYLRCFLRIVRLESGEFQGVIGVVYDITEDRLLQLKLERSLDEKNILIREVHHRVKNNMQLISSIMALKAYELDDQKSKQIFEDINTRIKAMSIIYDRLHKFYNVSEIEINDFLTHVVRELGLLLGTNEVGFNVNIIEEILSIDQALIIGLIINEMVTNAITHGFADRKDGTIYIRLFREKNSQYILAVTNDGKPINNDVLTQSPGIGMSLIKTFTKQLHGELSLHPENGFMIEF